MAAILRFRVPPEVAERLPPVGQPLRLIPAARGTPKIWNEIHLPVNISRYTRWAFGVYVDDPDVECFLELLR
eukprot:6149708-Alexandrium_andersonii.AAC.1